MKVCIIHGQNHKGSTYHMGRMLADKLAAENEITEFFLPADFDENCIGCINCIMKSENLCPHREKFLLIINAVDNADVIILASPVYVLHCTGQMKSLLDHFAFRWIVHRPCEKMFSKRGVVVSTCAGGGARSTNKDMKDSLKNWGVPKTYSMGRAVYAANWNNVSDKNKAWAEKKTDKIAASLKRDKFKPKVSFGYYMMFKLARFMNKKDYNKADSDYWHEKGWTEKKRPWKND